MSSPETAERAEGSLRAQLSVTVVLMILGVGMVIGGIDYGFGSPSSPGSGFAPCLIGVSLLGFGAVLLVKDVRGRGRDEDLFDEALADIVEGDVQYDTVDAPSGPSDSARLPAPLAVLLCMACFAFILLATESLGLLVTVSVAIAVLAYVMRTSWWASVLLGIGFYASSYVIFAMWLAIPLPFGTVTAG